VSPVGGVDALNSGSATGSILSQDEPASYFYDPTLHRYDDRLRPVIHVQPPQDDVDVPFHRPSRDAQRIGNLLIVEPLDDQTQNVQLTCDGPAVGQTITILRPDNTAFM
jgi:hypothetical protein